MKIHRTLAALAFALAAATAVSTTAQACDAPKVSYKFAHVVAPDEQHPFHAASLAFKKYVEEKTNCEVQINVFPGGQLGSDREMFEAMTIGTIDMGIISSPPISAFTTSLEGLNLPWLFNGDLDLLRASVRSEAGQKMFEAFREDTGVRAFDVTVVPFRDIISIRPITSNEQLNGFKMRVMQSPSNIATFAAVGANPTPLAFPEVYGALETGVIEGLENDVIGMYAGKLQEVAKHVTRSGHFNNPAVISINDSLYESMDPALQETIKEAATVAADKSYEVAKAQEQHITDVLKEQGVQFHEIDIQKLRDAMGPVYEQATSQSPVVAEFVESVNQLAGKSQ